MKLQDARKKAGLSQSKLADKAGMNVRTLQHYEQESKTFDNARIDTILRVAIALKCEIKDIIKNPEYIALLEEYERLFHKEKESRESEESDVIQ